MMTAVVLVVLMHGQFGDQLQMQGVEDAEACGNIGHTIVENAHRAEYWCLPASGHRPISPAPWARKP